MATDFSRIYKFGPVNAPQLCPRGCGNAISGTTTYFGEHKLIVQPGDADRLPEYVWDRCALKVCRCGQHYYTREPDNDRIGYSFECKKCEVCVPHVDRQGLCSSCILMNSGIEVKRLYSSLGSLVAPMRPGRSKFLDGLLKGLIIGAPGLVTEDRDVG